MIKTIQCIGFRGFSSRQELNLGIPNGKRGSGLTVIVGPNGGGKSTLVECFSKMASTTVSFTEGKRNKAAGDKVYISVSDEKNNIFEIETVANGGSETIVKGVSSKPKIYYLPARRVFNPFFGKNSWSRETFIENPEQTQFRANISTTITYRLFSALENYTNFNKVFWKILGQEIQWTIDQNDSNNYYIKINKKEKLFHNSDGLGEGIVSLLFLVDSIYDLNHNETIVIDEPELSLHPQIQYRLLNEFLEITKTEQIVIATHSPMMVSIEAAINGGVIARVHEDDGGSKINSIDDECREYFKSFSTDQNNPHVFGNEARASLFTEDGLILTEGQEDVVLLPEIISQLGLDIKLPFFGFGSGGASKIFNLAYILNRLGFKKVGALFDGDKEKEYREYNEKYSKFGYNAWILPATDIRDKESYCSVEKDGILDKRRKIKEEYIQKMNELVQSINKFVKSET